MAVEKPVYLRRCIYWQRGVFWAAHGHVISQHAPALYIRGVIQTPEGLEIKAAIQKSRNNQHIIKCAGQEVSSIAEIAKLLPVQALHLLNYQLLQTTPEARRKLLDWGVFHVKHSFLEQWRAFNQLLKQRNAALRQQQAPQKVWDELLAQAGDAVHEVRDKVAQGWFIQARPIIEELLELPGIELAYSPGWDTRQTLLEILSQGLTRDLSLGYTYYGPQRADLQIKTNERLAQHVLSQGQQKRLVAGLQITQSAWVYGQTSAPGVLLIDDLPAELDANAQKQIMRLLAQLKLQIFFTCVEEATAVGFAQTLGGKLFHVKHGGVAEV